MKAIKSELQSVVWDELFCGLSTEQCWLAFKQQIEGLQWKKPIWMTNKALRAVQQRRQVYRKYKDTSHPAYIKAAKSAHKLVDEAFKVELRGTVSTKN